MKDVYYSPLPYAVAPMVSKVYKNRLKGFDEAYITTLHFLVETLMSQRQG